MGIPKGVPEADPSRGKVATGAAPKGLPEASHFIVQALIAVSKTTTSPGLRRGAYLFAASSIGALLLAAFPTDVPATPISWRGAIHLDVAVLAFLGSAFGVLYISLGMAGNRAIARARSAALPVSIISVVFCLAELLGGFVVPHLFANYGG